MKLFIVCILATVIASSNAFFLGALGGGGWSNHRAAPQEYLHHHHHHHDIVHKSFSEEQHPSAIVKLIHSPVEVHPQQHVQIYKVIHEQAPQQHDFEQGHGLVYHQTPPHVITKFVQPIVHKNFIHNEHEHHYHQLASAPVQRHGWLH